MITQARKRFNSLHINFQMMILLSLLNLQDYFNTRFLVGGGYAKEMNPWLDYLIQKTGTVDVILLTKVLAVGFLWWIVLRTYETKPEVVTGTPLKWALIVSNIVYGGVVIWGILGIIQVLTNL